MNKLLYSFLALVLLAGCKKDETPEPSSLNSKWEQIPGNYKVYDSLGTFLNDMEITYSTQPDFNGGAIRFFKYKPFLEYGYVQVYQDATTPYSNNINFGHLEGVFDSQHNRWVITDLGSFAYDIQTNDTIEINLDKDNAAYWQEDSTIYHHEVVKLFAVKQH